MESKWINYNMNLSRVDYYLSFDSPKEDNSNIFCRVNASQCFWQVDERYLIMFGCIVFEIVEEHGELTNEETEDGRNHIFLQVKPHQGNSPSA